MIGAAKNMGITPKEALYDYSYANISLYAAAIPTYIPKDKKGDKGQRFKGTIYGEGTLQADDPKQQALLLRLTKGLKE